MTTAPYQPVKQRTKGIFTASAHPRQMENGNSFLDMMNCCTNDAGGGEEKQAYMRNLGTGRGGYIKETSYRFVGEGRGEFDLHEEEPEAKKSIWPWCCLLLMLALIALFVFGWMEAPEDLKDRIEKYNPLDHGDSANETDPSITHTIHHAKVQPTAAPTPAPTKAPTSAPTPAPTAAPTAAPTSAPKPAPVAPPGSGVFASTKLKISNVDYPSLVANKELEDKFTTEVQEGVALTVGNGCMPEDIFVSLAPGSVIATATVKEKKGLDMAAVKDELDNNIPKLKENVRVSVNMMHGLDNVKTAGNVGVDVLEVAFVKDPFLATTSTSTTTLAPATTTTTTTTVFDGPVTTSTSTLTKARCYDSGDCDDGLHCLETYDDNAPCREISKNCDCMKEKSDAEKAAEKLHEDKE